MLRPEPMEFSAMSSKMMRSNHTSNTPKKRRCRNIRSQNLIKGSLKRPTTAKSEGNFGCFLVVQKNNNKATKLLGTQRTNIIYHDLPLGCHQFSELHTQHTSNKTWQKGLTEIFSKSLSSSGCWLPFNHVGMFCHVYFGGLEPPDVATQILSQRSGFNHPGVQTCWWIKGSKNQQIGSVSKIPTPNDPFLVGNSWIFEFSLMLRHIHTVDGWNPKQPPGMYETL